MSDHKRSAVIFLCHASEDKQVVRKIYRKLKADGLEPWLDKEDLLPGQLWREEIPRVINSAACMLVFLSTTSIAKRGYVQKEFKLALETLDEIPDGRIFLIPVRIDDCDIPERFAGIHTCELFHEDGYQRIVKAIRTVVNSEPSNRGTHEAYDGEPPRDVDHPVSGTYRLQEERWEPDESLWQEMNEEPPGAILSIRMDSKKTGRCQLDSSVGKKLGKVHVNRGTVTVGIEDEGQVSTVSSVDESTLVLLRDESGPDDEIYVVTSMWDRLKSGPTADFERGTNYTLFIRKLICLESMYPADVVSLELGSSIKWTGEIHSGYEIPLGIEEEFRNAETIQLMIWDYGSTVDSVSKGGRCQQSRQGTISRRKAGQGEQVINLTGESGDSNTYDYELVYEVVENR